jgi:hypothetical protein
VVDVPSGLSLTPPQETKKKRKTTERCKWLKFYGFYRTWIMNLIGVEEFLTEVLFWNLPGRI